MRERSPKMIIRTNLDAPDIFIEDTLNSSVLPALSQMMDPSSVHYIRSKYLLYRVVECTNRINHRNRILFIKTYFHNF